jgi:hypothetical protein
MVVPTALLRAYTDRARRDRSTPLSFLFMLLRGECASRWGVGLDPQVGYTLCDRSAALALDLMEVKAALPTACPDIIGVAAAPDFEETPGARLTD